MTGFIERNGFVQYSSAPLLERTGQCDVCPPANTFFDHCHEHGWIRGELCGSHNQRLHSIDAGVRPERWEPWMAEYRRRCPECTPTVPVAARLLTADDMYRLNRCRRRLGDDLTEIIIAAFQFPRRQDAAGRSS